MLPCTRYAITDISKFNILTACSYPIPYTVLSKPATPVHSLMTVSMPRSTARSWWRLPSISVLAVRWFPPKRLTVPTLSCACTMSRPQSFPRSLPGLPPSDTRCAWARRSPAESLPPTSTLHCLHTRASAREQATDLVHHRHIHAPCEPGFIHETRRRALSTPTWIHC